MSEAPSDSAGMTSRRRRELLLDLATSPDGVSISEVYQRAADLGDTATPEAYYNIARRLAHRGMLVADSSSTPIRYRIGAEGGEQWLEENELAEFVDPDYPLLGITIWRESIQQINDVPESVWVELRERLASTPARELFLKAIISYLDDFHAEVCELASHAEPDGNEFTLLRKRADASRRFLVRFTKFALGLSDDAVVLPGSVDAAIRKIREGVAVSFFNEGLLKAELARRVEDGPLILEVSRAAPAQKPLVGAVDGSTRGGLLSLAGEAGDFTVGHAPLVNINTAVGEINRSLDYDGRRRHPFVRLPERPEDMQRQDNRHTVMAKLLHPDLSDAEYMHAVWNAMDLVETRATLRLLKRWYAEGTVEIPPADVVLRDGTVTPQERDFTHYKQRDSYGRITRDLIESSWEVALRCREDIRTVCGVVKASQLMIYSPVVNWFACQVALEEQSQVSAWPLESMNVVPDQLVMTRLLTAGRMKGDAWMRSCTVLRPFHAVTKLAYSRAERPADYILARHQRALESANDDREDQTFWDDFQGNNDAYVKMLRQAQYGSFYLAVVPRLDNDNTLPRFEMLVPSDTDDERPQAWSVVERHRNKVLDAIDAVGFDVAAEHQMFRTDPKLDVMPKLLIRAHDTVKIWAAELLGRVQEYVGYHLARHTKLKRSRGVKVRPFTRSELETLYGELRHERERQAGARQLAPVSE